MQPLTKKDPLFIILDCNLWIELITRKESSLREKIFSENYIIIVTSYMIVEVLRVLKRLSSRTNISYLQLEKSFWEFINRKNVRKIFQQSISESLIHEIKELPEIKIIASLLDLEHKDVPYIITAFQFNATLVTADFHSLLSRRDFIIQKLRINIFSKEEFLLQNLVERHH